MHGSKTPLTVALAVLAVWSPALAHGGNEATLQLSMHIERDKAGRATAAKVGVRNSSSGPVCLERNYQAPTRLFAVVSAEVVNDPKAFEGRPMAGCIELAAGKEVAVRFDLGSEYLRMVDRPGSSLCYAVGWRRGSYPAEESLLSSRVCAKLN